VGSGGSLTALGEHVACPPRSHDREPCGVVAIAFAGSGGGGGCSVVAGTKQGSVVRFPVTLSVGGGDAGCTSAPAATLTTGHCAGEVWALSVHPFELKFATGGDDNTVRVFDVEAQREVARRVLSAEPGSDRKAGHGASTMSPCVFTIFYCSMTRSL